MTSTMTDTPTLTPSIHNDVIEEMIQLQTQLNDIKQQIEILKPAFYDACEEQEDTKFKYGDVLIYRKVTPGKWTYPPHIEEQVQQVKGLQKEFRQTHEPDKGREPGWAIRFPKPPQVSE